TCNLRSAVSKDFMISGQFDKPNIPKSHDYMVTRPVALRISGPRSVSANGVAGWDWSSRRDGSYWFEIKTPQIHYKVQMDFMEPGKKGYIRLLASHKLTPGVPTIWQLEGLGFCTTAAKVEGKTKQ
ncbi:MAG TPA: hypothetical protein VGR09_11355, partial [Gemmatimonadales bacterium]|nr:hypothetical protein [Gemmatimonadales bacterium]